MGEKEYDVLMKVLAFVKIQNDTILQLLLDKRNYKTIYKEMVKIWEGVVEETIKESGESDDNREA